MILNLKYKLLKSFHIHFIILSCVLSFHQIIKLEFLTQKKDDSNSYLFYVIIIFQLLLSFLHIFRFNILFTLFALKNNFLSLHINTMNERLDHFLYDSFFLAIAFITFNYCQIRKKLLQCAISILLRKFIILRRSK